MRYINYLVAALCLLFVLSACGGGDSISNSQMGIMKAPPMQAPIINGVAQFTGPLGNYTITKIVGGYTVKDNVGNEGLVTLMNVDKLKFLDLTVNLLVQEKAAKITLEDLESILELYIAYFNRVPDADGLVYWIDQLQSGQTIEQIGASFYQAAIQFASLSGYSSVMSHADFVKVVYKNVLGRSDPDQEGLDYWTQNLANGSATRGTLIASMLRAAHGFKGDANFGYVADLLDNKVTVAKQFSIEQGLNYNTPEFSISKGMAISAAITPTDTSNARKLIDIQLTTTPTLSFAGKYLGTFSGSDSGTFKVDILANGEISGSAFSTIYGESFKIVGSTQAGGTVNMNATGTAGSSTFSGAIDLTTGGFSGTWQDGAAVEKGSFVGQNTSGPVRISGVVYFAPVSNARVTAYSVQQGAKSNPIATASSNDTGNFSLDLGTYTGVVLLEASGGTYFDAATGVSFNNSILRSVLPNLQQGNNVAHVTPYTEIIVLNASAKTGQLSYSNVVSVSANIKTQLNLDPVTTLPVNSASPSASTADANSRIYSNMIGGMAQYSAENSDKPFSMVIDDFAKLFLQDAFLSSPIIASSYNNFGANQLNQTGLAAGNIADGGTIINSTWCLPPSVTHAGSIACQAPTPQTRCVAPKVALNGICISPTLTNGTPTSSTCKAPNVVQDGICRSPIATTGVDASSCIKVGYKASPYLNHDSQTLTNTCNKEIHVIYCHTPSQRSGTKESACEYNGRYFQREKVLAPGQIGDNFYNLPVGTNIHFGACFGSYYTTIQDKNGYYHCSK